jgi:hypothetical protein
MWAPFDAEVAYQRTAMPGMLCEAGGSVDVAAARASRAVVMQEAILRGEDRFVEKRHEPVGEDPGVDEHNGLGAPANYVFELDTVEDRSIHQVANGAIISSRLVVEEHVDDFLDRPHEVGDGIGPGARMTPTADALRSAERIDDLVEGDPFVFVESRQSRLECVHVHALVGPQPTVGRPRDQPVGSANSSPSMLRPGRADGLCPHMSHIGGGTADLLHSTAHACLGH